jgi:GAF domain-containing protein
MTQHPDGSAEGLQRRLTQSTDLESVLEVALDAAIALHRADFGNIQLYRGGVLTIVAQRGFDQPFLDRFKTVSIADDSACGRALREGRSVVIADVESDPEFADFRHVASAAGFRAVQSTPLVTSRGQFVGMLSTHFAEPYVPSKAEMTLVGFCATVAADAVWPYVSADGFTP